MIKTTIKTIIFLSITVSMFLVSCKNIENPGNVYFIPTLHGLHKTNINYSYDSLISIVAELRPDIIAVEIRPEDIDQDSLYLADSYPYEMRMIKSWFPNAKIVGFDWLGSDIEGRLIPASYWDTMEVKVLQEEIAKDSVYYNRLEYCRKIMSERMSLISNMTLKQMLNSDDAKLVTQYYNCLEKVVKDSPYHRLYDFSKERDEKILENINKIIASHKNKRIVIITGDDHYVMLKNKFPHKRINVD